MPLCMWMPGTTSSTKRRTTAAGAAGGADIININAMGLKDPTDIFTTVSSDCKHGGSDKVIIQELVFKPYSHQQLKSILKQRLTISTQHGKEEGRFQDAALDLACRRVAAIHGDCRKVLDVCRHTITN
ncbi:hypothetical protein FOZ62_027398, partial [Perkinsus olseni]